jgi:hypothetical protein
MADKPFVINDRRKFTAEGELRPDIVHEERKPEPPKAVEEHAPSKGPQLVHESDTTSAPRDEASPISEDNLPPPPTQDQIDQATRAYNATVDRLDTAVRAMDPGANHPPPMNFERLVQSLYMQTLIQLGGVPEPGQPPQVDLMGARSTIDMLAVIADKSKGNLTPAEESLIQAALFEVRLGFLDITQALAQQAAKRQSQPGATPTIPPPPGGGPSLIR